MAQGYIKLHRQIFENDLYFSEPFSRMQAWIDLLLLANHKEGKIIKRGNIIKVERGQVGYSVLALSARWQWSRGKVMRFLKHLENEQQIEQQKNAVTTLITVLNYDRYQQNGQQTEQQTDNRRTTDGQQTDTNKNVNNDNNEKNDKKEKVTANKSRSKKTDFIDSLISEFAAEYKAANNFDYVTTNKGKERSATGKILREYKNKNPDSDSETTRADLRHYFRMCVNIPDNWMRQNMSLSLINSKFNEINNILKYGNQARNKQGATDAELASIISKHFATDYKKE